MTPLLKHEKKKARHWLEYRLEGIIMMNQSTGSWSWPGAEMREWFNRTGWEEPPGRGVGQKGCPELEVGVHDANNLDLCPKWS